MTSQIYKPLEIVTLCTNYLQEKGIENPRLNAELLVGHVLNLNRVNLYLNFERPLSQEEIDEIRKLLKRRGSQEPLQYILGQTEFFSLNFKLNRQTLIPRPETEILVEKIIENIGSEGIDEQIKILDIGTGSGNIAIALATKLKKSKITAIDIQPQAIEIAIENSKLNEVENQISFMNLDFFSNSLPIPAEFDVIVSNPPYVTKQEMQELPFEVKNFEPNIALQGGSDGLQFYRRIIHLIESEIVVNKFIAVEIGAFIYQQVHHLFEESKIFQRVEIFKDLNNLPRVIIAWK